ncbi:MAG: acyltransferase family protein [Breznakibacter sp.]
MDKSTRYLALDVMRGMTIALMITVNNPGSWSYIYAPLKHAAWHGCTPTDLVFPFFLFVVGVSMFFSFSKYQSTLNRESLMRIGKRTLLIFAIGLFLNSFPQWKTDWSHFRIMGVMQRIALVYGIGSILVLALSRKALMGAASGILLLYWAILYWGGGDDPYSLTGSAAYAFDRLIIPDAHLYKGFGEAFDPEGLLSTLPAIVTALLGYLAAGVIQGEAKTKVPGKLLMWGALGVAIGWGWSYLLPLNKSLWSSSYVVYTGGLATICLAILIYLIDVKSYKKWTSFFVVFGMNPLFIFAFAGVWGRFLSVLIRIPVGEGKTIGANTWLYQNVFVPMAGNLNGSLLYALANIAFFWLIGWVLYNRKIFIKV